MANAMHAMNDHTRSPGSPMLQVEHTAEVNARLRMFSDIKYAGRTYRTAIATVKDRLGTNPFESWDGEEKMAPAIEARSKLIKELARDIRIDGRKSKQLVNAGAGWDLPFTLGMAMTANREWTILHMDLPFTAGLMGAAVPHIIGSQRHPDGFHIIAGNVVDPTWIRDAGRYLNNDDPVTLTVAGVITWLSEAERILALRNFWKITNWFRGRLISPDTLLTVVRDTEETISRYTSKLSLVGGVDIRANSYRSIEESKQFYFEAGFVLEELHQYTEARDRLTSPKKLREAGIAISDKEVEDQLKHSAVMVLRPRDDLRWTSNQS